MNSTGWFRKDIDTLKQAKQYLLATATDDPNEFNSNLIKKQVGEYFETCDYSFYNYPDGLLKTSVQQLSLFMSTMMNNGQFQQRVILKPSTITKAITLQIKGNDIQGLGWKKINFKNFSLWGHSGRDPGVRTHMYFDPKMKTGIILFQNNDEGSTIKLIETLFHLLKGYS